MDITARLKELLEERDWTAGQLSRESGVPESTIRSLFSRNAEPTVRTLEAICRGLRIEPRQLLGETGAGLSEEERRLLFQWSCLRERDKALVGALIESLAEKG